MGKERPTPWSDALMCAACGRLLLPLSYDFRVDTNRPSLKCPGCGQCYEWRDSAGWVPVEAETVSDEAEESIVDS
jgi:transcription elongation factor Elf1